MYYSLFLLLVATPATLGYAWRATKKRPRQKTSSQKITFVVFDFDGTLADSFHAAIATCNALATRYKLPTITAAQIEEIRQLSMRDIITKRLKIPWYKITFFHAKATRFMAENAPTLKPFQNIATTLKNLKKQGYGLGIITSNNRTAVKNFLRRNSIDVFDVLYTDSSLFGKHRVMRSFLRKHRLSAHNIVYVGDEVRDIEAAKTAGIRMIAVGWGYNSQEILRANQPDAFIATPQELAQTIGDLQLHEAASVKQT